jgi:hypothetical protein
MAGSVRLTLQPAPRWCSRCEARERRATRGASYAVVAEGELTERSCPFVASDPGMLIQASSSGTTGAAATALDSFSAVATFTGSPRAAADAVAKAMPAPRATAVNVRPRICTARVNSGPNRKRVLTGTRTAVAEPHDRWTQLRPSSGMQSQPTRPMAKPVASQCPSLE